MAPETVNAVPSASHCVMALHDTELRYEKLAPGGTGTEAWKNPKLSDPLSFQTNEMALCASPPTAMQNEVPTHETLFKLSDAPVGTERFPAGNQTEPFHCSARICPPVDSSSDPTAMQRYDVEQDTASNPLCPVPGGPLTSVQWLAETSGGLEGVLAPAGGVATSPPTTSAVSAPAAPRTNVRNVVTAFAYLSPLRAARVCCET
jgi:hypothetical protein